MANITINSNGVLNVSNASGSRKIVWTTDQIGYAFSLDSSQNDLGYQKTTDGGQTWAAIVDIKAGTGNTWSVWFDKWTPGNTGTIIHVFYDDTGTDDFHYRTLDTNGDSLGTERTLRAQATNIGNSGVASGCVGVGGKRYGYLFANAAATHDHCFRSSDGVTWSAMATVGEGAAADKADLFPANLADTNDIWALFHDASADELSLKTYDDSGDSWSEQSISTGIVENAAGWPNFGGAIRHSDGHLICAAWTAHDDAGADLKVWDITNAGTITAKTDVVTNSDDCMCVGIYIDQLTNHIYVAYIGKSDGSETIGTSVNVYYKKSTDGGTSWGAETLLSDAAGNFNQLSVALSGTGASRFEPIWADAGNTDVLTNYANSVVTGILTVTVAAALKKLLFSGSVEQRDLVEADSILVKVRASLNANMQPAARITSTTAKVSASVNVSHRQLVTIDSDIAKVAASLNVEQEDDGISLHISSTTRKVAASLSSEQRQLLSVASFIEGLAAGLNVSQRDLVTIDSDLVRLAASLSMQSRNNVTVAATLVKALASLSAEQRQTLTVTAVLDGAAAAMNLIQRYQLNVGTALEPVGASLQASYTQINLVTVATALAHLIFGASAYIDPPGIIHLAGRKDADIALSGRSEPGIVLAGEKDLGIALTGQKDAGLTLTGRRSATITLGGSR